MIDPNCCIDYFYWKACDCFLFYYCREDILWISYCMANKREISNSCMWPHFFHEHYFCCKKRDNSLLSHCDFLSLRHWWSIFVAILLTCIELQSPLITYRMQCLYRWCVSWLVFTRSVCFNSFSPATTAIITSVKRFQFLVCIY